MTAAWRCAARKRIGRSAAVPLVCCTLATALMWPRDVRAQEAAFEDVKPVIVHRDNGEEIRGRLVRLDAETLSVLVDGRRLDLPASSVLQLDSGSDSIRNGALIGAIFGGAVCALVCGQGLDDSSMLPVGIAINAVFWGGIGAGIDALVPGRTTIYRRPAPPAQARAAIAYRLRF